MKKIVLISFALIVILGLVYFFFYKGDNNKQANASFNLALPNGFNAVKVADSLGEVRHIAIAPNGNVYVKLAQTIKNKGILQLNEVNGKLMVKQSFANYGGTGIYIKDQYLYASSNKDVFRYKLNSSFEVENSSKPEKIISQLKMGRQHETKSLVVDNDGNIYVNIGAYSNACQIEDRVPGSLGIPNCPILDSAGGIWQFKTNLLNQSYGQGTRYATGLRNVVGLDWNNENQTLFVMQHGRDELSNLFPSIYTDKMNAETPAECMYMLKKGDHAGWPYSYYDYHKKKNMLAPEYGGDAQKEADPSFLKPIVAFPAHLAPNGLLFYTGNQFPERYKNGAFVAFHGSWNRSPEKQEGFFVAFVPFKNGKPTGNWEIFANGFAGIKEVMSTNEAQYRPCGLAQGPDGSLYVTDDHKGSIFKISYHGK